MPIANFSQSAGPDTSAELVTGQVHTDAFRNKGVLHRNAVTAPDKLAVPGTITRTAVTESGSTLPNSALNIAVSAFNQYGPTGPGTMPAAITPTANQAVRLAFAQVPGATGYNIFVSTDAAPLLVGTITEGQRAAGGFIISAVNTVTAGGGAGAGAVDIGIVGTGPASTATQFVNNNAYTPATLTPINCAGAKSAHVLVKVTVTDFRSSPTLTIVPFTQSQTSPGDWFQGVAQTLSLLTGDGQSLLTDFYLPVDGATGLVLLVSAISGQGTAVSIFVELA